MAKIYWFTGTSGVGKTVLAEKLVDFLQTEKRNWRKQVFHIDEENLKDLLSLKKFTKDITSNIQKSTQIIAEYLYNTDSDVVVSIKPLSRSSLNEFKSIIGNDFEEFYLHTSSKASKNEVDEFKPPISNYFDVDTTKDNPIQSFNKIVHFLQESEGV